MKLLQIILYFLITFIGYSNDINNSINSLSVEKKDYALAFIKILKENNFRNSIKVTVAKSFDDYHIDNLEILLRNGSSISQKIDNGISSKTIKEYENFVRDDLTMMKKMPFIDSPSLSYFSKNQGARIIKFSCSRIEFGKEKIKFLKLPSKKILFDSPEIIFY